MVVSSLSLLPLSMMVLVVCGHEREVPFQGVQERVHHMEQQPGHGGGGEHMEQPPVVPPNVQHDTRLHVEEADTENEKQNAEHRAAYQDHMHSHDKEHLREHMDGMVNQDEQLSEDEANFRFFKVHDYDDNNLLDGIELMAALTDYHPHGDAAEGAPEPERLTVSRVEELIDGLLHDADKTGDGYIDYFEYMSMQKVE